MEPLPHIVMQCPKCKQGFSHDVIYCDVCSALLEPVEMEPDEPSGRIVLERTPSPSLPSDAERFEDLRLDSLKSDIERRFALTVLLELSHLKKRLKKKEAADPSSQNSAYSSMIRNEAGADEALKKIAKLEAILDNLRKKLESDIDDLTTRVSGLMKPKFSSFFTPDGRYYRATASALNLKQRLLEVINGRRPASSIRGGRRLVTAAAGVAFALLLGVAFFLGESLRDPAAVPRQSGKTAAVSEITVQEISNLLEDIRMANLTKDLPRWESRYSRAYLDQPGKREGQTDQWNRYHYRTLTYRIESLDLKPRSATAVVSWEMVLNAVSGSETRVVAQRLQSDFVIENGVVKIAGVRKAGP